MRVRGLSCLFIGLSILLVAATLHAQVQRAELINAPLPAESTSAVTIPLAAGTMGAFAVSPAPPVRAQHPRLNWLDWSGIGAAATLRVLDYTSTEQGLRYPQYVHEDMLPKALVENKPGFAAFQAGTVALNYEAYRMLVRHHRRSLAQISQALYVGTLSFQVGRNYQLLGTVPGR